MSEWRRHNNISTHIHNNNNYQRNNINRDEYTLIVYNIISMCVMNSHINNYDNYNIHVNNVMFCFLNINGSLLCGMVLGYIAIGPLRQIQCLECLHIRTYIVQEKK